MALVVALLLLGLCAGGSGGKIPLHFFYMTTKTGFFRASGAIPVVDLALEQINNRTDILPNYSLTYTSILDSQVLYSLISYVTLGVNLYQYAVQCNSISGRLLRALQRRLQPHLLVPSLLWLLHCHCPCGRNQPSLEHPSCT